MGDFKKAFDRTMQYEGGYSNDSADRGGETYKGISRNNWPAWVGWITIDNLKFTNLPFSANIHLQKDVEDFYRREFWSKIHGDELPDPLATELFDCAVNHGIGRAVKWLQTALSIEADGVLGIKTLVAVKAESTVGLEAINVLVASIKEQRHAFYDQIVVNDPSQAKFLNGWHRRADESVT